MLYNNDWNAVIQGLELDQGEVKTPDAKFYLNTDGRFDQIITKWKAAEYDKSDSVEWINYYPEKHFPVKIIKDFETWSGTKCARSWISRIRPGKMAPLHQDIDDHIEKYLEQGTLIRYGVLMSKPSPGAIFMFEDRAYHLEPQGTVFVWKNYLEWHAGANCGFEDKFMFHFLGITSE
jgi:hypothetical protein